MRKILAGLVILMVLALTGCGGSAHGRSGPGGGVGASVPAVVWADHKG